MIEFCCYVKKILHREKFKPSYYNAVLALLRFFLHEKESNWAGTMQVYIVWLAKWPSLIGTLHKSKPNWMGSSTFNLFAHEYLILNVNNIFLSFRGWKKINVVHAHMSSNKPWSLCVCVWDYAKVLRNVGSMLTVVVEWQLYDLMLTKMATFVRMNRWCHRTKSNRWP